MWRNLIVAIVSVLLGSLLTLIGQPIINEKIQQAKVPTLVREIYRPDISGLSTELQNKVTILPVKYTIEHKAGGAAKNVTITLNSTEPVKLSELRFGERSESHTLEQINNNAIKINVPVVRPAGILTFELLTGVSNKLQFQELAEEGKIIGAGAFETQNKKSNLLMVIGIALIILVWGALVSIVVVGSRRIGSHWRNIENGAEKTINGLRGSLITLMIILIVYDLVVGSLGPLGGFLPLPRVSFSELFYAFSLYLLVTRYKLIEDILRKNAGNDSK